MSLVVKLDDIPLLIPCSLSCTTYLLHSLLPLSPQNLLLHMAAKWAKSYGTCKKQSRQNRCVDMAKRKEREVRSLIGPQKLVIQKYDDQFKKSACLGLMKSYCTAPSLQYFKKRQVKTSTNISELIGYVCFCNLNVTFPVFP